MNTDQGSYTDKFKATQDRLKKRSEGLFKNGPVFDEPAVTGDPDKILDQEMDKESNQPPLKNK